MGPRAGEDGAEKLALSGVRTPDRLGRSESLSRPPTHTHVCVYLYIYNECKLLFSDSFNQVKKGS